MSFRDEGDATEARIGELTRKLADAETELRTLRGETPPGDAAGEVLGPPNSFGLPSSLRIERVLDHTITPAGYEAIARVLSQRCGITARQVGNALLADGRFELRREKDGTRIVMDLRLVDQRAGRGIVGVTAGVLGAPALTMGALFAYYFSSIALGLGEPSPPPPAAIVAAIGLGAPLLGVAATRALRGAHQRSLERALQNERGTFAAVLQLAEEHRSGPVRARVSVPEEPAAAAEDDASIAEHEAARSARR